MDLKQINLVCNAFRSKYKGVLIQSAIARFALIILAVGVFSSILDFVFHLGIFARLMILMFAFIGAGLMFWWTYFVSIKKSWSDKQILAYLDTTEETDKRGILELFELIKAENIQETNNDIGKGFINEAVNELNQRLSRISYGKAVKTNSFQKWVYALAGLVAMIGVMGVVDAEKTKIGAIRYINPFSLLDWPSKTKITVFPPKEYTVTIKTKDNKSSEYKFDNVKDKSFEISVGSDASNSIVIKEMLPKQIKLSVTRDKIFVEDLVSDQSVKISGQKLIGRTEYKPEAILSVGNSDININETVKSPWSIPQLEAVKVSALVSGEIPSQATIVYKSILTNYEIKEKINIAKNGEISYEFPSVKEDISFYIKAGDYETRPQKISVIQRPFLKKIIAEYKLPAYAGIANKKVESGQLTGLEGTEVTLTFESSMPLSKAVFNLEEVGREDLKQINATTYTKTIMLEKNGAYSIELYEKSGFRESRPERFDIKVDPDAKPVIELYAPGANLSETKNASIQVAFKVTDDFGIKSLGVYYKIDEASEFKLLSDKITGPIEVGGKKSEVKFNWDLKKMDLPDSATIRYFVKAQDVNPTNNGITQTNEYEIKLIKLSEYHQEAILKAKVLITEARIAWKNQIDAYREGQAWEAKPENKVNDTVWQAMVDKQESALRAVDTMNSYLTVLTDKIDRNRMQKEFMSVRLNSIITDMQDMTTKEMGVVQEKLNTTKPKTDEEAGRIKAIRLASHKKFEEHQKMSVLYLDRIVKKLYDWSDLQETTIKSTNLFERQTEILEKTIELAPITIGVDPKDLKDEQVTALAELAKQQKSIYEAESSLELMLEYLMVKAQKFDRKTIQVPLGAAFKNLRNKRINDSLKEIDKAIDDNRLSNIIDEQRLVANVMNEVKAGLIKAGMVVDADQPLKGEISKVDITDDPPPPGPSDTTKPKNPDIDPIEPPGGNGSTEPGEVVIVEWVNDLTLEINNLITRQDKIRARLKYLASIKDSRVMPRLTQMKMRRISELQADSIGTMKQVIELAVKDKNDFVSKELTRTQDYFVESQKLITAKDISEAHQSFIEGCSSHLRNLIQLIGKEKEVIGIVEEHARQSGKDSFGRLFLAQSDDMKWLSDISMELFKAYVYQAHINSGMSRFSKNSTVSAEMKSLDSTVRSAMVTLESDVKKTIDAEKLRSEKLSELVLEKFKTYDGYKIFSAELEKITGNIKSGKDDMQTSIEANTFGSNLFSFVSSLKDLMDERVKVVLPPIPPGGPDARGGGIVVVKDLAYILKLIEDSNMPEDQKEICRRSLHSDFAGKYKELLTEYFITVAEEQGVKK